MSNQQIEHTVVRVFAIAMLLLAAVHTYKVVIAVRERASAVAASIQ